MCEWCASDVYEVKCCDIDIEECVWNVDLRLWNVYFSILKWWIFLINYVNILNFELFV